MSKPEDKKSSPTIFLEIFSDKKFIYIKVNLNEIAESFFYNKKHVYVKANLNNIAEGFFLDFSTIRNASNHIKANLNNIAKFLLEF